LAKLVYSRLDKKDIMGHIPDTLQEFYLFISDWWTRVQHKDDGIGIRYKSLGDLDMGRVESSHSWRVQQANPLRKKCGRNVYLNPTDKPVNVRNISLIDKYLRTKFWQDGKGD